ncbi:hypothetical protein LPJ61_005067, partial [Coemansia biformis]
MATAGSNTLASRGLVSGVVADGLKVVQRMLQTMLGVNQTWTATEFNPEDGPPGITVPPIRMAAAAMADNITLIASNGTDLQDTADLVAEFYF